MIDEKKLQQFLQKMIGDFGAAMSVPLVRIGMRLGLYKALNGTGPMTSAEFATSVKIPNAMRANDRRRCPSRGRGTMGPASREEG